MRSLTYDVDALGQAMAWSLGHWMIATVILGVIVSRLAHHNDIDHSGAGKVLLAYFGNGLVFVFLSCFIMAIEFAIMFDSPSSFQTDRMPIGPFVLWIIINLFLVLVTIAIIAQWSSSKLYDGGATAAKVIFYSGVPLALSGNICLQIGAVVWPGFFNPVWLYSLNKDMQELTIGLVVLPIVLILFAQFVMWVGN